MPRFEHTDAAIVSSKRRRSNDNLNKLEDADGHSAHDDKDHHDNLVLIPHSPHKHDIRFDSDTYIELCNLDDEHHPAPPLLVPLDPQHTDPNTHLHSPPRHHILEPPLTHTEDAETVLETATFTHTSLNESPHTGDDDDATAVKSITPVLLEDGTVLASYTPFFHERFYNYCKQKGLLGVLYVISSAVLFSFMSMFVHLAALVQSPALPSFEIVFVRCLFQFVLGSIALIVMKVSPFEPRSKLYWLIARGAVGMLAFSCFYYALAVLPLGDATVLFFTAPLWTGLLGRIFLKEQYDWKEGLFALVSIVGCVLVARPSFIFGAASSDAIQSNTDAWKHTSGVLVALLGSVVSSCVYITIRKIGKGVQPMSLVWWMGCAGVVLSPIGMAIQGGALGPSSWSGACFGYIIGVGIMSFLGQILFNRGVQLQSAAAAAMQRNSDVVFAFIWQATILQEAVNGLSVLGAVIVTAAVVGSGLRKYLKELSERRDRERERTSVVDS